MHALAVTPMFFALLAPLLGAAGSFIGQAIIGVAVSFGLSYLVRRQQPQPADVAPRGMSLSLQVDSNEPRQVAFGRCASASALPSPSWLKLLVPPNELSSTGRKVFPLPRQLSWRLWHVEG